MNLAQFLRKYSLRAGQGVKYVRSRPATDQSLPVGIVLHCITDNTIEGGISQNHPLVFNYNYGEVRVDHAEVLPKEKGRWRPRQAQTGKIKAGYFRKNVDLRRSRELIKTIDSARSLVVRDYTLLQLMAEYPELELSLYNEWYNLRLAMMQAMDEVYPTRSNMLLINVPSELPEITDIKLAEADLQKTQADKWTSHEALDLLMLFKYVEGQGILSTLSQEVQDDLTIALYHRGIVSFVPLSAIRTEDAPATQYRYLLEVLSNLINSAPEVIHTEEIEEPETVLDLVKAPDDIITVGDMIYDTVKVPAALGVSEEEIAEFPEVFTAITELGESNIISVREQKKIIDLLNESKNLKLDPLSETTIVDQAKRASSLTSKGMENTIKDNVHVKAEDSYFHSTVSNLKVKYAREHLEDDIAAIFMKLADAGIVVQGASKKTIQDAQTTVTEYSFQVLPVGGKPSTIKFQVPLVKDNGTFKVFGVDLTMDTQLVDAPISKTKPDTVALTSYYGKSFVRRSDKSATNSQKWLRNTLIKVGLDGNNNTVTDLSFGKSSGISTSLPLDYTGIGTNVKSFTSNGYSFFFDYRHRDEFFTKMDIAKIESDHDGVLVAKKTGKVLIMTSSNVLLEYDGKQAIPAGRIDEFTKLPGNRPADFAEITVFGRAVPVCIFLSYILGFEKLLKKLGIKYEIHAKGTRINPSVTDVVLKFRDDTIVIDGSNPTTSLLMNGFIRVKDELKLLRVDQLNRRITYQSFNPRLGVNNYTWKETENLYKMFIDPMTKDYLDNMGEPSKYVPLVIRAVDLLKDDYYPEDTMVRLRGYERFSGFIYKEIVDGLRSMNATPNIRSRTLNVNPRGVLLNIINDPTTQLHEGLNPIHELKEMEAVNLGGTGGRDTKTLVKKTRAYRNSDLGVISEATPDSSKVGIRTFMTPDANLTSMRGTTKALSKDDGAAKVLSTTALLMPGSNHDDASRVNMINVQFSAMVGAKGYQSMPMRTGYEQAIGHRVSNEYAYKMPVDGTVVKVEKDMMSVSTTDGNIINIQLGTIHGTAAGSVFPHQIVTDMSEGDTVSAGDVVAWNAWYFQRDWMNPGNVEFLTGAMANVVMMENSKSFEDSSAISPRLAGKLSTANSKKKVIIVPFHKVISGLVGVGDKVDLDSTLCYIKDPESNIEGMDESLSGLDKFSISSPKAKFIGDVSKIEVYYIGKKDEMSDSLKDVVSKYDKVRKRQNERLNNGDSPTGEILEQKALFGGSELTAGHVAIIVYIDSDLSAGIGDKGVIGSQLKTIFGKIIDPATRTASGTPVDVIFSMRSVMDRIVLSSEIQGIGNRCSIEHTAAAVKLWKKLTKS